MSPYSPSVSILATHGPTLVAWIERGRLQIGWSGIVRERDERSTEDARREIQYALLAHLLGSVGANLPSTLTHEAAR